MAVDIHLHREGHPRLHLHVQQTEGPIQVIEIQDQARPQILVEFRPAGAIADAEGPADFQGRIDAHQTLSDTILFGQGAGVLLHRLVMRRQVPVGTPGGCGQLLGMSFDLLGEPGGRILEITPARRQVLPVQADLLGMHPHTAVTRIGHRQMSADDHPIETRKDSADFVGMFG